jgi:hypothetical protein
MELVWSRNDIAEVIEPAALRAHVNFLVHIHTDLEQ